MLITEQVAIAPCTDPVQGDFLLLMQSCTVGSRSDHGLFAFDGILLKDFCDAFIDRLRNGFGIGLQIGARRPL
jgi:hypothetical protein